MWSPNYFPGYLKPMNAKQARYSLAREKLSFPPYLSDNTYHTGGLDMDDEYQIPQMSGLSVEQEDEEEPSSEKDKNTDEVLIHFDSGKHENMTEDDVYKSRNRIITPVRFQSKVSAKPRLLFGQMPTVTLPVTVPAQTYVPISAPVTHQVLTNVYGTTSAGTHIYVPAQAVQSQIPVTVPHAVIPHTIQYGVQLP
ncbi:unnamed protein product, partial [Heterobilharzia americana]